MSGGCKRGRLSVPSASRRLSVPSASRRLKAEHNHRLSGNSCNCSCSVPCAMGGDGDGAGSQNNKMKRLRTRKERNQSRDSGEVASNRKLHHHHPNHHHPNHTCSKDKPPSQSCSQTSSQCGQRKEAGFVRLFPNAQEPSVITTNRLIGHQGLFNREVKSIDIERLLSKQRKQERLRQPGLQEHHLDAIHLVPYSHPSSPCSSSEAHLANSIEGVLIERDSDVAVHQENAIVDCQSHGSAITPGQRPQIPDISSENENLQATKSPGDLLKCKRKTKAVLSVMEKETALTEGNENVRPELEKVNTRVNSSTPKNQTLAWTPSPDSPNQLWRNSVSAVARRLCHSLKLPLLRRGNMLAESREVLLLALRKSHGPLFREDLLRVQRRLSFGDHAAQGPDAVPPATQSGRDVEWRTSPRVAKVRDELLRPDFCSRFTMGLEPSASSPPCHHLAFSPASQWAEVDPPMPQPWDKRFKNERMRASVDMGCVEGSWLNQATAGQPARRPADSGQRPGEYTPVELDRRSLATSSLSWYSREEDYQHPFYHFHRPTKPFPQPYHGDMMHYPPSDLLDRPRSSPLTSFNSPEQWSFPPMRLY
ncbi:hypothetical protein NHX12_001089 [Muraenolepis orangiensis]|uniref:Uncharacterized protein n=1 Tax=Muraenolepis orangiensis TaxID=630683 RepID=A0A9Q0IHU3_9TELE|nr:hypothetical protein NHX12_001089 [Muraenolepis orangiensis]